MLKEIKVVLVQNPFHQALLFIISLLLLDTKEDNLPYKIHLKGALFEDIHLVFYIHLAVVILLILMVAILLDPHLFHIQEEVPYN